MTVETGSGGYHLYFKSDMLLSKDNTGAVLPGVDFIGEGGYVVAPPSQTSKGKYTNLADADPAPLPAAVLPYLRVKGPSTGTAPAPAERPRRHHPTGPHRHTPFPWGTVSYDRVPSLIADMIHRFPIARTGEHSNRDDQTIRMVAYLLVVGHSPATAKEVGRHWLAAQQDQFKTSLSDADQPAGREDPADLPGHPAGKAGTSHGGAVAGPDKKSRFLVPACFSFYLRNARHPNTTGLGGQRKQLSPRESAYVLAVLRLVLFKLLETDESSILVTNRQLMDLAGLSDPKQTRRMRDKFISEGKRLAGVMELLVLEKKGGKKKGKGFPSSYALWRRPWCPVGVGAGVRGSLRPCNGGFRRPRDVPQARLGPRARPWSQERNRRQERALRTQAVRREGERCPTEPRSRPAVQEFPAPGSAQERRTRNERQGGGRSVIGRIGESHGATKFAFDRNPRMPGSRPKTRCSHASSPVGGRTDRELGI